MTTKITKIQTGFRLIDGSKVNEIIDAVNNGSASSSTLTTLTDAPTIAWNPNTAPLAAVTLGGNRTLAFPSGLLPGTATLKVIQDAVGSRTLTFASGYKFPGGQVPVFSTGANSVDVVSIVSDGVTIDVVVQLGFA